MNNIIKEQLEILNIQIKKLEGIYRDAGLMAEMSENEFWIWYLLVMLDGEYSQQDICDTWKMSKQTVNTIIRQMVRRGYVSLSLIPGTRHRKKICLTEAGRKYGESIVLPVARAEQRAFEKLPAELRDTFNRALNEYIDCLKAELEHCDIKLPESEAREIRRPLRKRRLRA